MTDALDDNELLAQLQGVLDALDPPPSTGIETAYAAFDWRTIDAELAQLVFDSQVDKGTGDLVLRSSEGSRQLTFSTTAVTIDLELRATSLVGQIIPPQPAMIEVHQHDREPILLDADEFGVFSVDPLDTSPTTIVALAADGSWAVRTAWTAT